MRQFANGRQPRLASEAPVHLDWVSLCADMPAACRAGRSCLGADAAVVCWAAVAGVLSSAAYVAPDLVLPLVHQRFETAFETVTAAHLLVTAIHTLGLCARPLLLAGLRVSELGAPEEAPSGSYRPEMRDFEVRLPPLPSSEAANGRGGGVRLFSAAA